MIGVIICDIIGLKVVKRFTNTDRGGFTDNTVMTVAVAEALTRAKKTEELENVLKDIMMDYSSRYSNAAHIGFDNGFAACVSPYGYIAESFEGALALAEASTINWILALIK